MYILVNTCVDNAASVHVFGEPIASVHVSHAVLAATPPLASCWLCKHAITHKHDAGLDFLHGCVCAKEKSERLK